MSLSIKPSILLAGGCLLIFAGCGGSTDSSTKSNNAGSSGSSPLTAPVDYLGAVGKAQQSAVKTVDTARLNQAVQLFQVDHGRNPKDLNELVTGKYISELPQVPFGTKLNYDPGSGQVSVVKQQ